MGRHLVAAATAASLAIGTAAMGVTTYALRLADFNAKRRRDHEKKKRKAKGLPGSPDSPTFKVKDIQPKSSLSPVYVTNVFVNALGKDGTMPSSITINVPSDGREKLQKREFRLANVFANEAKSFQRSFSSLSSQGQYVTLTNRNSLTSAHSTQVVRSWNKRCGNTFCLSKQDQQARTYGCRECRRHRIHCYGKTAWQVWRSGDLT
jgi:hypothetical protein